MMERPNIHSQTHQTLSRVCCLPMTNKLWQGMKMAKSPFGRLTKRTHLPQHSTHTAMQSLRLLYQPMVRPSFHVEKTVVSEDGVSQTVNQPTFSTCGPQVCPPTHSSQTPKAAGSLLQVKTRSFACLIRPQEKSLARCPVIMVPSTP